MSRETVLFLMPAYNEAKQIKRTVISWLPIVKSIPGSEILIINDGSTDGTRDLLAGLEAGLPRDGEPLVGLEGADEFAAEKKSAAEAPVVGGQRRVGVAGA